MIALRSGGEHGGFFARGDSEAESEAESEEEAGCKSQESERPKDEGIRAFEFFVL